MCALLIPFAVASGLGAMAAVFPAPALYERRAGGT